MQGLRLTEKALHDIWHAAKVDQPNEGKHELAVRLMAMAGVALDELGREGE